MVNLAKTVWRDFVTDGVPASGNWKPHKADVRQWGAYIETQQTGSSFAFAFSSATSDADPGNGTFRLNNASPASATAIYLDNIDGVGADISTVIDTWDDSTNAVRGVLTIRGVTDETLVRTFNVTGSVVTGAGYRKIIVAYSGGAGSFVDGDDYMVTFARSGDQGGLLTNLTNLASGDVNIDMANAINNASAGGGPFYTHITATDHNVDRSSDGLWGGILRLVHNVGGLAMRGYRIAFQSLLIHDQKAQHAENQFVAATFQAVGHAAGAFNGTGLTAATAKGGLFGANSYVGAISGYTNLFNTTSHEFNSAMLTGSSVFLQTVAQFATMDEIQGSEVSCIISIGGAGQTPKPGGGVYPGLKHGILFGSQNAGLPVEVATGTLIGDYYNPTSAIPLQTRDAINLSQWTFSRWLMNFKGFTVSAAGSVEAGDPTVAGTVVYDFHSSGNAVDYDVRLASSGGSGVAGTGLFTVLAGQVNLPINTYNGNARVLAEHISVLTADRLGADVNTAQAIFAAAEDSFNALSGGLYEFEAEYHISRAAGTTSHTFATLFGGTATFLSMDYFAEVINPTGNVLSNLQGLHATAATATVLTAANTSATEYISVKLTGTMRINAGGTVIPQFQYSAAPGGAPTIKRNSKFAARLVGLSTDAHVGDWA